MSKNFVIVESPTKARKLAAYLGKDFIVEASVGHVRDLPKKELGIDLDHNFAVKYVTSQDKTKVIKILKQAANQAEKIYLAMDPDREGEAIAWHVKTLLEEDAAKPGNKSKTHTLQFARSTFHEITKQAVLEAINHPSTLNMDLVNAQQARRVLDRLVGYKVSPVLWKKVRVGLSAGRVQSVALRLIVEREKEIKAFEPEEYWQIEVALVASAEPKHHQTGEKEKFINLFQDEKLIATAPAELLVVTLDKIKEKKFGQPVFTQDQAQPVINDLKQATYLVKNVEKKERSRQSLPPFTTSLLQQAAATRLGFSSKQTMSLAQQLYEEGLITYHRTDSFNLSSSAIQMARDYIQQQFGGRYLPAQARLFRKTAKNAQEAHEAIRVTHVDWTPDQIIDKGKRFTHQHVKLYDLIWRRFLASQMAGASYDQTTVTVEARVGKNQAKLENQTKPDYELKSTGSIMKFDGWTKLFSNNQDTILPEVQVGEQMDYLQLNPMQKFTQPPARYNDASLVKELEKRGIGRPSTYASIISVIQDRGYVEKTDKRFFATAIGITVNDFLQKNFAKIMDYDFTAAMEEDLDEIALGKKAWKTIVAEFWQPLASIIDKVVETAERAQIPVEKTGEACPECGASEGGEIVIRTGRYGKFKSCSRFPECKFTQNIVEKLPDQHCPLCGQGEILIKKTRWGKDFFGCSRYPQCNWASWQKPTPDLHISPEEWQEMQAKRQARAEARQARFGKTSGKTAGKKKGKKAAKKSVKKTSTKTTSTKTTKRKAKSTT